MAPFRQNMNQPLPPLNAPIQQIQASNTSPDNVSEVTEPSNQASSTATTQIGPQDQGQPKTPERLVINSTNNELVEEGYDSDGLRAPWEGNEEEDYSEEELLHVMQTAESGGDVPVVEAMGNPNPTVLTEAAMVSMKVSELKEELKKRALSTRGNKREILQRLKDAVAANAPLVAEMGSETIENLAGDTFDPGARWELLTQDESEPVDEEVLNVAGVSFHGPTSETAGGGAKKLNYSEHFDRMVFTGSAKQPKIYANGRIALDQNRNVLYEVKPHTETVPNLEFCQENGLDLDSHPVEWFKAFLPIENTRSRRQNGNHGAMEFSIESCLSWTNTKARLQNAGLGGKYPDFRDFTLDELMQHIALYLFQGLSPSPQVEMKFKSCEEDPINGSDLVHRAFGSKSSVSVKRHKHFKAFFASVDPLIPTPPRETHPNWKVHPFLKHINRVSKKAVHLGRDLSCDEQTVGFQGNHKDKMRITYKKEGDGFMADCICCDGYTFNFHFRHQAASQNLIRQGLSPLHARVAGLVSQLPNKYYTLGMDNLYNSAKFYRYLYSMEQKVMAHGIARASGRGVPKSVMQKELTSKRDIENVRHTVKVAIVKGDSVCNPLVCVSLYDSKPVYLLSMVCSEVKWIAKARKIWHKGKNCFVEIKFLRLNVIDFYNYNMGSVDLADQLRNTYRYDTQWHRNRKWWWAVWWWGFQLLLTNSYKLYCIFHRVHQVESTALSHYDFIKSIVLAWIDKEAYWPAPKKRKRKADWGVVIEQRMNSRSDRTRRTLYPSSSSSIVSNGGSSSSSTARTGGNSNLTVTDLSLDPIRGPLRCRLNQYITHFPEASQNKRAKCQLHRWARGRKGKEVRTQIAHCSSCHVDLCYACWKTFHQCPNIIELKEDIAQS